MYNKFYFKKYQKMHMIPENSTDDGKQMSWMFMMFFSMK